MFTSTHSKNKPNISAAVGLHSVRSRSSPRPCDLTDSAHPRRLVRLHGSATSSLPQLTATEAD